MSSIDRYDLRIHLAEPHPAPLIETSATSVAGVERAQAFSTDTAALVHADGNSGNTFTLIGVPPDSPMLNVDVARGRWLNARDRNVLVVSERLLRDEPGLTPDTDVTLTIGGETSTWRVVGVDPTVVRSLAYTPFTTLKDLHGHDRVNELVVAIRNTNSATKLDVIMRLRAELERQNMHVASSELLSETRRATEDHLLMVVQFLSVMAWVMIAVGGMGLASTMSLAVLERTREIGVLRAIGARHGAIMLIIQAEGIVIAALAWLVSLPLSAPMSVVLAIAFGKVMFPVPVQPLPNAGAALAWLVLVLVISLLACAWPGSRAMRIPTAATLSYE